MWGLVINTRDLASCFLNSSVRRPEASASSIFFDERRSVISGTNRSCWCHSVSMRLPAIILLMGFMTVGLMSAQTRRLEFDVATLKAEAPLQPEESYSANLGTIRNGKVTLTNVTLSDCIKFAYGLVSDTQVFGPDWIKSRDVRYEIVGQAPPDTPQDQILVMLQKLLVERLMLVVRHEQRELPFLALTVAKDGPRLAPAKEGGDAPRLGAGRIIHPRMPMSVLATLLSRFERQTVINLTGLNGSFAVNLQWTP